MASVFFMRCMFFNYVRKLLRLKINISALKLKNKKLFFSVLDCFFLEIIFLQQFIFGVAKYFFIEQTFFPNPFLYWQGNKFKLIFFVSYIRLM